MLRHHAIVMTPDICWQGRALTQAWLGKRSGIVGTSLWLDDQSTLHPGMLFAMIWKTTRRRRRETERRLGGHIC